MLAERSFQAKSCQSRKTERCLTERCLAPTVYCLPPITSKNTRLTAATANNDSPKAAINKYASGPIKVVVLHSRQSLATSDCNHSHSDFTEAALSCLYRYLD